MREVETRTIADSLSPGEQPRAPFSRNPTRWAPVHERVRQWNDGGCLSWSCRGRRRTGAGRLSVLSGWQRRGSRLLLVVRGHSTPRGHPEKLTNRRVARSNHLRPPTAPFPSTLLDLASTNSQFRTRQPIRYVSLLSLVRLPRPTGSEAVAWPEGVEERSCEFRAAKVEGRGRSSASFRARSDRGEGERPSLDVSSHSPHRRTSPTRRPWPLRRCRASLPRTQPPPQPTRLLRPPPALKIRRLFPLCCAGEEETLGAARAR